MSNAIRRAVKHHHIVSKHEMRNQTLPKVFINNEMASNGFLSPPNPFSNDPLFVQSHEDLRTLKRDNNNNNIIARPMTAIDPAEVDPEIQMIRKADGNYHVRLSLNANFFNPLKRPSSAMPATAYNSEMMESNYASYHNQHLYERPASVANHFLTGYNSETLTDRDRTRQVYNANNIISSDLLGYAPANAFSSGTTFPISSTQRNTKSKTLVNVDATRNQATIRRQADLQDDDFIIKSIKSTEKSALANGERADEDVKLDLHLFAKTQVRETAPIIQTETIKLKPTQKIESRKTSTPKKTRKMIRPIDEDVRDQTKLTSRTLQREVNSEKETIAMKREKVNAMTEANEKETIQKSCNTDPMVASTGVQTLSVSNTAVQTDFIPEPEPVIIREPAARYMKRPIEDDFQDINSQKTVRQIHLSHQEYDVPDYENVRQDDFEESSGFIRRLLEGAPRGSLHQKMDVKKEDDQIVGPLPREEIERMYNNSMINVDSVSEKVDLTLSDGVAQLLVIITYERIAPIQDSPDTFKKSAVVVTKVIDVDLTVTEERKKIYDHIIESHKNGRLDNKYTFELYKAFIALAEKDEGLGLNQEHFTIEKKVDEEKLWNINNNLTEAGDQQLNLKILENKLSDFSKQETTTYRPSTSSETRKSFRQWESNEMNNSAPSSFVSFEGKNFDWHKSPGIASDSFEYNSANTIRSTASYNRKLAEDFYKEKSSANWKSIFNNWTNEADSRSHALLAQSGQGRLSSRINAYEYLKSNGNRTHKTKFDPNVFDLKSMTTVIKETKNEGSMSNGLLEYAGIKPGSHRQRMDSYTQNLKERSPSPMPNNYIDIFP